MRLRWGCLALFGAVLLWALLGKVIPNLVPDGERIARLREPLDYWNALALVGAMTLPLALWAAVRREHPWLLRVASVVVAFAAVVVVLLTYSRGGVVVALLAPAAYIALTRKRVEAAAALVVAFVPAALLCLWAFQQPGLVEDGQPYDERLREGLWFAIGLLLAGAVVAGVAYLGVTHEDRWRSRVSVRFSRRQLAALVAVPVALVVLLLVVADPIDRARDSYREFTNPVTSAGHGPGAAQGLRVEQPLDLVGGGVAALGGQSGRGNRGRDVLAGAEAAADEHDGGDRAAQPRAPVPLRDWSGRLPARRRRRCGGGLRDRPCAAAVGRARGGGGPRRWQSWLSPISRMR